MSIERISTAMTGSWHTYIYAGKGDMQDRSNYFCNCKSLKWGNQKSLDNIPMCRRTIGDVTDDYVKISDVPVTDDWKYIHDEVDRVIAAMQASDEPSQISDTIKQLFSTCKAVEQNHELSDYVNKAGLYVCSVVDPKSGRMFYKYGASERLHELMDFILQVRKYGYEVSVRKIRTMGRNSAADKLVLIDSWCDQRNVGIRDAFWGHISIVDVSDYVDRV